MVIDSSTFPVYSNSNNIRKQVWEWVLKGLLLPLKKGLYIFSEEYRQINPEPLFIANILTVPSYVSLEYAMGFYNLIPEKVTVYTSVTTKKTKEFINCIGRFEYRSLTPKLFFGYKKETFNEQGVFIAVPEKALADYFYLNPDSKADFAYFESLRLQNMEILNTRIINSYIKKYNKRVQKILKCLLEYIKMTKKSYKTL